MWKCIVLCFYLVTLSRNVYGSLVEKQLAETTQVCCEQGKTYARNHSYEDCSSSVIPQVPPAFGSLCIFAMDQCCKEHFDKKNDCDAGIQTAIDKQRCYSTNSSETLQRCCTECDKGLAAGSRGERCEVQVQGNSDEELLAVEAFTQCCKKAREHKDERTESHSTEQNKHESASRSQAGSAVIASLCEEYAPNELCAHHCIPVPGSYKCECNPGFMLMPDGRNCREVTKNRCKPRNPCQHKCNDNGVEVKCSCRRGYRLMTDGKSCEDIDECVLDPPVCLSSTECHNVHGSYKCIPLKKTNNHGEKGQCPPGFSKNVNNNACDDINECQLLHPPCPSFLCENTVGGYKCGGVSGDPGNLANNRPVVDDRCPPGFKTGYSGECEDVDECALHKDDCNPLSQFCINTRGSYHCQDMVSKHCPPGFKIDPRTNKCEDINECEDGQDICRPDQVCLNVLGEYDCKPKNEYRPGMDKCADGMRMKPGSSVCEDIDECVEGTHLCDAYQSCLNTNGSHECRCKLGYELDSITGACIDVNECATDQHNCIPGSQRCDNTVGSFLCVRFTSCGTGYILHHSTSQCEDIDECALGTHNCARAGPSYQCENHPGSFRCVRKRPSTTSTTLAPEYEYEYYDSEEEVTDGNQTQPSVNQPAPKVEPESTTTTTTAPITNPPPPPSPPTSPSTAATQMIEPSERPEEKDIRTNVVPQSNFDRPEERRPEEPRQPEKQPETTNYEPRYPESPDQTRQSAKFPGQYQPRQPWEAPAVPKQPEQNTEPKVWEVPKQAKPSEQYPESSQQYPWETSEQPRQPDKYPEEPRQPLETPSQPRQPEKPSEDPRISWVPWKTPEQKPNEQESNVIDTHHEIVQETTYKSSEPSPTPPQMVNVRVGEETATVQGEKAKDGSVLVDTGDVPKNKWTKVNEKPSNCQPGFEVDEYGACYDIDECSTNHHSCSGLTETCRNTMGGYLCDCAPGFRRDLLTGVCDIITTSSSTTSTTLPPPRPSTSQSYFWGYPEYRPQNTRPFRPRNLCDAGYHLNSSTGKCEDINECTNGQANCAAVEICVNTEGGYRCECPPNWRLDEIRHRCLPVRSNGQFPSGYGNVPAYPPVNPEDTSNQQVFKGKKYEEPSITSLGDRGNVISCRNGYKLGYDNTCEDIDECSTGQASCGTMLCTNLPGGYVCSCPPGHKLVGGNRCEDVDECTLGGNVPICSQNADCVNTVGSYQCRCHTGFRSAPVNDKVCVDVDECTDSPLGSLCQQRCNNVWGGYRCSCHRGYRLNPDNSTCSDIDECTAFKSKVPCVGRCLNEPGSYRCTCPQGYRLSEDKKSCIDIDECETGEAPCANGGTYGGSSDACVNTRGGFRCHRIICPTGYKLESKHRCTRMEKFCQPADWECAHQPSTYSYNFITFVSKLYIPDSKVDLFTMKGPAWPNAKTRFTLRLVDVNAPPTVKDRANINSFLLIQKGHQAVMSLVRSLEGPQSIELELSMELYNGEQFGGIAVARLYIFISEYEF